jgi:hypothetical protein
VIAVLLLLLLMLLYPRLTPLLALRFIRVKAALRPLALLLPGLLVLMLVVLMFPLTVLEFLPPRRLTAMRS